MTITTTLDRKPAPDRNFDWEAIRGDWDLGDPIGYGSTESAAVRALQEAIVDGQERFEVRYQVEYDEATGGGAEWPRAGWYVHDHDAGGLDQQRGSYYRTHPEAHARLLELLEASWP